MAAAQPLSQEAAAKTTLLADLAEEAERNALECSLLDEADRLQSEADGYERKLQSILTSAEQVASAAAASSAASAAGVGASPTVAEEAAVKETQGSLRAIHERAIAAMEMQNECRRRAAAGKLAQRRAVARTARVEAMQAAGSSDEQIAKELAEASKHTAISRTWQRMQFGTEHMGQKQGGLIKVKACIRRISSNVQPLGPMLKME